MKNKYSFLYVTFCLYLGLMQSSFTYAETFVLPAQGDVVGEIQHTTVYHGESLGDVGRRYGMGVYEMIEANPTLDPWVPRTGSHVVVPAQFILPPGPRVGIVLNLAEMRLYYYHPDKRHVSTYAVGIGKKGWSSPLGHSSIISKTKDPSWTPPPSIRKEHLRKGDILPAVVPAGPKNPLGRYALKLGFPGFLLHGSHRPGGIGVRSSHGCIRLFNKDIEKLYHQVPVGTSIRIIHEPYKVGFKEGHLYLEAHEALTDAKYRGCDSDAALARVIQRAIKDIHGLNWSNIQHAARTARGYPTRIN